jgi:hypothetical protein
MSVAVKAEQALILDQCLHALMVWVYQFDWLAIVITHGFEKLIGFFVQPTGVERKHVNLQAKFAHQIDEHDIFSTAE